MKNRIEAQIQRAIVAAQHAVTVPSRTNTRGTPLLDRLADRRPTEDDRSAA